jgi:hypothetical protein
VRKVFEKIGILESPEKKLMRETIEAKNNLNRRFIRRVLP